MKIQRMINSFVKQFFVLPNDFLRKYLVRHPFPWPTEMNVLQQDQLHNPFILKISYNKNKLS